MKISAQRGLIVSCQALPGEPLYGCGVMAPIAAAAEQAGALGIRTNGTEDIRAIKQAVGLPVIGLIKREIPGSEIYITPTMEEVEAILAAGADIVALDMTDRENRHGQVEAMVQEIHRAGALVMADISTFVEGVMAEELGADYVSTTLSGYTSYSPQQEGPDFALIGQLAGCLKAPVVAEGRIWSPAEAVQALEVGAQYVVVGSAITRPQLIAGRFATQVSRFLEGRREIT